jgi:hypothetical protein
MRWADHVARKGDIRNAYKILIGKPEEKRLLVRPRRRWENGFKRHKLERCCLHSSGSGLGPVVNSCELSNELPGSLKAGNFLTS